MCFRSRAQRMASTCFSGLQFRFIIEAGKETDEISITSECQYVFIVEYTICNLFVENKFQFDVEYNRVSYDEWTAVQILNVKISKSSINYSKLEH